MHTYLSIKNKIHLKFFLFSFFYFKYTIDCSDNIDIHKNGKALIIIQQ